MSSSLNPDVRDHLAKYLSGEESLDEFKDWLVGALLDAEQANDAAAEDFILDIMLPMAEESSGYISEDRMREALHPLLKPIPATATT